MLNGSQVVTIDMRTTRRTAMERQNGCDSRLHVIFPGSRFLLRKDTRESVLPWYVWQCDGKRDLCNRPGAVAGLPGSRSAPEGKRIAFTIDQLAAAIMVPTGPIRYFFIFV